MVKLVVAARAVQSALGRYRSEVVEGTQARGEDQEDQSWFVAILKHG